MKSARNIIEQSGSAAEGIYFIWGLVFAGWSPMLAATGYWIEEAVIFVLTVSALIYLKIKKGTRVFLARFIFIYGFFFFVHSVFFIILAAITSKQDKASDEIIDAFFRFATGGSVHFSHGIKTELAKIILVVIVGAAYTVFFRLRSADPAVLINRSFGAVIAAHFLLIFGCGAILLTGAPYVLASVLVLIKILIDLSGFSEKGSPVISPDES